MPVKSLKFFRNDNVSLVYDQTYGLLKNSKYALVTSGTATLEAALFKVPQVVCYKTNWLTYIIGRLLIKINYLSLVNILLNHLVVKELIQSELTKENLRLEIDSMIKNQEDIISDYNKIINLLTFCSKCLCKISPGTAIIKPNAVVMSA